MYEELKRDIKMKVVYEWEDCTMGFDCPNCGAELIADSQDGTMECECGLEYMLSTTLYLNGEPVTEYESKRQKRLKEIVLNENSCENNERRRI
jgi:DNA-directed RNA polymerase subunit M/transcription elongation factor TFIIS